MLDDDRRLPFLNLRLLTPVQGEAHELEYMEIVKKGFRHRITAKRRRTVAEALPGPLAEFVSDRLSRIDKPNMVYTDPDVVFEGPNVTLANLQIIASIASSGVQHRTFRFARIMGKINGLLNDVRSRVTAERDDIAMDSYENVLKRGSDIARYSDMANSIGTENDSIRAGLAEIKRHQQELVFRLGLLARATEDKEHP